MKIKTYTYKFEKNITNLWRGAFELTTWAREGYLDMDDHIAALAKEGWKEFYRDDTRRVNPTDPHPKITISFGKSE